ncbi:uncharacterized protein LOC144517519 [Sander vitreus]
MKFPVDLLADVSHTELERLAHNYMNNLLYSNPDAPEHLTLPDSTQVTINICSVGFVPLYGSSDKQKVLALFSPTEPLTAVALYLLDQWWPVDDILKTGDPARDGAVEVETVGERIVLYILNRVVYRAREMSSEELPFLCHGEKDHAKILWSNGEAVGFYSVKPSGSFSNSFATRSYQLPVMDSIFVRRCQRGKGFGLQMLEDFVLTFKEDCLGLRYPLTKPMYKVCEKYLRQFPGDTDLLWEVESVGGPNQRTNMASKIQAMDHSAVSRSLSFTEESLVITEMTEKDVVITTQIKDAESMECTVEIVEEVTVLSATKAGSEAEVPLTARGRSSGSKRRKTAEEKVIRIEDIEAETPRKEQENVSESMQTKAVSVAPEEQGQDVVDTAATMSEQPDANLKPQDLETADVTSAAMTEEAPVEANAPQDLNNTARESQITVENVASEMEEECQEEDTAAPVVSEEVLELHTEAKTLDKVGEETQITDEKWEERVPQHEVSLSPRETSENGEAGRTGETTVQSKTRRPRYTHHSKPEEGVKEETADQDGGISLRRRTVMNTPTPKRKYTRRCQKVYEDSEKEVAEENDVSAEGAEELAETGEGVKEDAVELEELREEKQQLEDEQQLTNEEKTEKQPEAKVKGTALREEEEGEHVEHGSEREKEADLGAGASAGGEQAHEQVEEQEEVADRPEEEISTEELSAVEEETIPKAEEAAGDVIASTEGNEEESKDETEPVSVMEAAEEGEAVSVSAAADDDTSAATETTDTADVETAVRDTAATETAVRDTADVETAVRDTAATETAVGDTAATETAVRDTADVETAVRDTVDVETAVRDTVDVETAVGDTAATETAVRDTADVETAVRDTADVETAVRDTAATETAVRDTAATETAVRDTAATETAVRDTAATETAVRDTAATETAVRDTADVETAVGDTAAATETAVGDTAAATETAVRQAEEPQEKESGPEISKLQKATVILVDIKTSCHHLSVKKADETAADGQSGAAEKQQKEEDGGKQEDIKDTCVEVSAEAQTAEKEQLQEDNSEKEESVEEEKSEAEEALVPEIRDDTGEGVSEEAARGTDEVEAVAIRVEEKQSADGEPENADQSPPAAEVDEADKAMSLEEEDAPVVETRALRRRTKTSTATTRSRKQVDAHEAEEEPAVTARTLRGGRTSASHTPKGKSRRGRKHIQEEERKGEEETGAEEEEAAKEAAKEKRAIEGEERVEEEGEEKVEEEGEEKVEEKGEGKVEGEETVEEEAEEKVEGEEKVEEEEKEKFEEEGKGNVEGEERVEEEGEGKVEGEEKVEEAASEKEESVEPEIDVEEGKAVAERGRDAAEDPSEGVSRDADKEEEALGEECGERKAAMGGEEGELAPATVIRSLRSGGETSKAPKSRSRRSKKQPDEEEEEEGQRQLQNQEEEPKESAEEAEEEEETGLGLIEDSPTEVEEAVTAETGESSEGTVPVTEEEAAEDSVQEGDTDTSLPKPSADSAVLPPSGEEEQRSAQLSVSHTDVQEEAAAAEEALPAEAEEEKREEAAIAEEEVPEGTENPELEKVTGEEDKVEAVPTADPGEGRANEEDAEGVNDEEQEATVPETRARRKQAGQATPRSRLTRSRQENAEVGKEAASESQKEEPSVQVRVLRRGRKLIPVTQRRTTKRTHPEEEEEEEGVQEEEGGDESAAGEVRKAEEEEEQQQIVDQEKAKRLDERDATEPVETMDAEMSEDKEETVAEEAVLQQDASEQGQAHRAGTAADVDTDVGQPADEGKSSGVQEEVVPTQETVEGEQSTSAVTGSPRETLETAEDGEAKGVSEEEEAPITERATTRGKTTNRQEEEAAGEKSTEDNEPAAGTRVLRKGKRSAAATPRGKPKRVRTQPQTKQEEEEEAASAEETQAEETKADEKEDNSDEKTEEKDGDEAAAEQEEEATQPEVEMEKEEAVAEKEDWSTVPEPCEDGQERLPLGKRAEETPHTDEGKGY